MSLIISNNEELNKKVFDGFKTAKRFIEVVGRPLNDIEIYTFYLVTENLFDLRSVYGVFEFSFYDGDTTIVNPFYEPNGLFIVSPVAEYGELFLNSRFICLIKELMELNISEDNYLDISKKISAKYTTKALKSIEYDFE